MGMKAEFTYRPDNHIDLGDWLNISTLCLAPLVLHIVSGVPTPTYLERNRPRWHDVFVHYNPTSILWRYFIVTDRRVRCKSWTAASMAATNALFWTADGWDGSEAMMGKSVEFLTRVSSRTRIGLLSMSAFKTLTVTLQGLQATYAVTPGVEKRQTAGELVALPTIFFPLAMLGLTRLTAALWLTDDYSYADYSDNVHLIQSPVESPSPPKSPTSPLSRAKTLTNMGMITETEIRPAAEEFHSRKSWRGVLVRLIFPLPLVSLFVVTWMYILTYGQNATVTYTQWIYNLFYIIYMTTSIGIIYAYMFLGRDTTTIIPCITSTWYKIYTGIFVLMAVVLVLIAALETKRITCGEYTTIPDESPHWPYAWVLMCPKYK